MKSTTTRVLIASLLATVNAQSSASSCTVSVSTTVPAPSVAPGFEVRLVATGLTTPRGIAFDDKGNLLVVESGAGVTALTLNDGGGSCVSVSRQSNVVTDTSLNHGITLSFDGATLYTSSPEAVYSYPYDSGSIKAGDSTMLVANMTTSDHTTRTLLLSKKDNGTLIVTRGSTSNFDPEAGDITTGHSQIKAFSLLNLTAQAYNFNDDGRLLGWGLRNEVGIDEEPNTGGLYSVENSADEVRRSGKDIHQDNPAEEMNFLGYLRPENGTVQSANQGKNFGYPSCYTAWDATTIPNYSGQVGQQFAINTLNATNNDTICQSNYVAPRIAMQAHMAPLDIKFNSAGSEAWVTLHGSWDRTNPVGYKVGAIAFAAGEPTEPSTSNTALTDIVSNQDNSKCPDNCFRPVGMAWDSQGRLFFSSDKTGEIYVITKAGATGNGGNSSGVDSAMPSSTASAASSTSSKKSAAPHVSAVSTSLLCLALLFVFGLI